MTKIIIDGKEYDYDSAVSLMDEEIRELLHGRLAGDVTEQQFIDAYCEAHFAKYGEQFIVN